MSVGVTPSLRRLVWKRDSGWCVRCLRPLLHEAHSIHHRRARMMGGTSDPRINDPRNLLLLCGSGTTGCHGWVESNRHAARRLGYLIDSLDDAELDRPVVTLWVALQFDAQGGRHEVRLGVSEPEQA